MGENTSKVLVCDYRCTYNLYMTMIIYTDIIYIFEDISIYIYL